MTLVVLVLACVITLSGGFIVGAVVGAAWQRERAEARRPLAPHEVLAQLRAREQATR